MAVGSGPFHGTLWRASTRLTELCPMGHPFESSAELSSQVDCLMRSTNSTVPSFVPKGNAGPDAAATGLDSSGGATTARAPIDTRTLAKARRALGIGSFLSRMKAERE